LEIGLRGNSNVVISGFDDSKIAGFLDHYTELRRGQRTENIRPSQKILNVTLQKFCT
jgi:hypothetical protein